MTGEVSASRELLGVYESELFTIVDQKNAVTDRSKLIELTRKENETAKYVRAYRKLSGGGVMDDLDINQSYEGELPEVVTVGERWINNSTYAFGGGRNDYEIAQGLFDCSSFVHWAFDQVGIELGNRTSVTTDTLKYVGYSVSYENIQPGDLVFFDTYKVDGHVGIYAGDGMFIGAQGSTGVAYESMDGGYWRERFNDRIIRILWIS